MADKNPYPPGHPRWQLWEQIRSQESLHRSHSQDAERYTRLAAEAGNLAQTYRDELATLEAAAPFKGKACA